MSIDKALETAMKRAVEDAGQPKAVAQRLIAWLEALSATSVSEESQRRFYENVRETLDVGEGVANAN